MSEDYLLIHFEDGEQLTAWLEKNGETHDEVWVEIYKKHTGVKSIAWAEIVDTVLCFGWIDSQSRRIDEDRYRQRLTPRRKRSKWSKINREKVEVLIADGRMRPAGLAEVERAREDGRWEAAYDGAATAKVPEQFSKALEAAGLTEEFSKLKLQDRYAMLHRIQTAKREETRARLIEKFCGMISRGETIN
ncbi:MAG: YdeI/OmpD-associated family protein [Solirubrobacterales bacterium]|nr:YdeI/OmpD-associated family protein [Solirubrobacterales bacterium]